MRSVPSNPQSVNFLINALIEGLSAVSMVFLLLGSLLGHRTQTRKPSDHSEPPDGWLMVSLV